MKPIEWLSREIEFARVKKGLTKKALAEAMGIHPVSLFRYATGEIDPPLFLGLKLCRFLEIDLSQAPPLDDVKLSHRRPRKGSTDVLLPTGS